MFILKRKLRSSRLSQILLSKKLLAPNIQLSCEEIEREQEERVHIQHFRLTRCIQAIRRLS